MSGWALRGNGCTQASQQEAERTAIAMSQRVAQRVAGGDPRSLGGLAVKACSLPASG